jgi:hypothetical protein
MPLIEVVVLSWYTLSGPSSVCYVVLRKTSMNLKLLFLFYTAENKKVPYRKDIVHPTGFFEKGPG